MYIKINEKPTVLENLHQSLRFVCFSPPLPQIQIQTEDVPQDGLATCLDGVLVSEKAAEEIQILTAVLLKGIV